MNIALKYGLITGVGVCIWILSEFALGFHTTRLEAGKYTGYFAMIIRLITLFLALREKRDSVSKSSGRFTIQQGLGTGITVSVVSGIVTAAFMYVYNGVFNPGWMVAAAEMEGRKMLRAASSAKAVEAQIAQYKSLMSEPLHSLLIIVSTIIMSAVISLVLSLI